MRSQAAEHLAAKRTVIAVDAIQVNNRKKLNSTSREYRTFSRRISISYVLLIDGRWDSQAEIVNGKDAGEIEGGQQDLRAEKEIARCLPRFPAQTTAPSIQYSLAPRKQITEQETAYESRHSRSNDQILPDITAIRFYSSFFPLYDDSADYPTSRFVDQTQSVGAYDDEL